MQQYDLVFIRHGQSKINQATKAIVHKYNIPNSYTSLKNYPEWTIGVKYSMDFVDCSLSEKGKDQCLKARRKTDQVRPDVVLVSPLQRTLQTCNYLFGDRGIPIISIRSSCDLSTDVKQKIQRFPHFNFDSVLKQDQYWTIQYDEQNNPNYLQKIHELGATTISQKNKAVLAYMSEHDSYETPKNLRKRIKKIKELLGKYKQKYNTIAVVAHFNIINYISAKQFDENHEPKNSIKISNCQLYQTFFAEIQKYE